MVELEIIRTLYGYDRWVNRLLMETAEEVSHDELGRSYGMSFDTILGTLGHILGAERRWLKRFRSEAGDEPPHADTTGGIEGLKGQWARHDEEMDAYLAGLTSEQLARPVRFTHSDGSTRELPLWKLMVHIVNHGTHHRAEVADMLTRAGHEPKPTGFRGYCLEL